MDQAVAEVDALIAPGVLRTAPPVEADSPHAHHGRHGNAGGRLRGNSRGKQSLAGLPALVSGFAERLPVALQLVGAPFSENTLLALGNAFQAGTDWHKQRPPGVSA